MRFFKKLLLMSFCLVITLGFNNYSSGQTVDKSKTAVDKTVETLNEIQNQIISLRNEFKLRVQKAEEDQVTIYEYIQTKLEELINSQQSLNKSYPAFKEKVEELKTLLDTYNDKIMTLEQTVDTMESTMYENLDNIEQRIADIKSQGLDRTPKTVEHDGSDESQTEPPPSLDFAPGDLFRAVYRVYMDGDYEIAIAGFQKYLADYPNTQLAGAAQYWIAESFAKLGEYGMAVEEYDRLISNYPQNDKVADAYYGKGIALLRLERPTEANSQFTYVVEHFPGTIAAKKAGNRLEEIR
jgi:tol-pal system protein YbgF